MPSKNFSPTYWGGTVLVAKRKSAAYTSPLVTNRNYQGIIANAGDTVKLTQIGAVAVSAYTDATTITYGNLTSGSVNMTIDQADVFSFKVEDIDAAQSNVDLSMAGLDDAGYRLRDTSDQYVAAKGVAEAGIKTNLGTEATPLEINSANIVEFFGRMQAALLDAGNPFGERWFIVIPPQIYLKLVIAKVLDVRTTSVQEATTAYIQNFMGFNILVSNNAPATTPATPSAAAYKILAGSVDAITYAEQISNVESLRIEGRYGDGIRGLHLYGAKVIRPNSLALSVVNAAAEA